MMIKFTPSKAVCARQIIIEVSDDNIVQDVLFIGGCSGNAQGIGKLAKGMAVDEVIERLKDVKCGYKNSSCPAELAKALMENRDSAENGTND